MIGGLSQQELDEEEILLMTMVKNLDTNEVSTLLDVETRVKSNFSVKNLPLSRYGAVLVELDGIVYIFGGESNETYLNAKPAIVAFNAKYNRWNTLVPDEVAPMSRCFASGCAIDGLIYYYGGISPSAGGLVFPDVFSYDPVLARFDFSFFTSIPLYGHTSVVMNGLIYVFGGCGLDNCSESGFYAMYVGKKTMTVVQSKTKNPPGRVFHTSCVHDDSIYVFGGQSQTILQTDHSGSVSSDSCVLQSLNDLWIFKNGSWKEIQTEFATGAYPLLFSKEKLYLTHNSTLFKNSGKSSEWDEIKVVNDLGTSSVVFDNTIYTIECFGKRISSTLSRAPPKDILECFVRDSNWILLGAGEVGKSTIYKQLKKINGEPDDLMGYYGIILENILNSLKRVSTEALDFQFLQYMCQFPDGISEYGAEDLYNDEVYNNLVKYKKTYCDLIDKIWNYQVVYVPDGLVHFVDNIENYVPKFVPTFEDYVCGYRKTTGGTSFSIRRGLTRFQFFDTGGQRNERKKWHYFGFNKVCYEDEETNRLIEDLKLFGESVNTQFFLDQPILLLLNKKDRLEQLLNDRGDKDIEFLFPGEYKSSENQTNSSRYETVVKFIAHKFQEQLKGDLKRLTIQIISALETDSVRQAFEAKESFSFPLRVNRTDLCDVIVI